MASTGGRTGGGGGSHWIEVEAPDFRSRIRQTLTSKLARYYQPRHAPDSQEAQRFVANFEEGAFSGTNSKEDYLRNISNRLLIMEKKTSEHLKRRMQLRSQLQPANAAQALQGCNSSVRPEAAMMANTRPTSQPMAPQTSGLAPNQHMVYPHTTNMQTEVEQKHPGMMKILDQRPNFQPAGITTVGPGVGPWRMQSGASQSQSQSQYASRQAQATDFVGCSPPSVSKPARGPNSLQNHLLGQNGSSIGTRQPQLTRMNQQSLRANQQEMDMQKCQMLEAQQADISKMQPSQSGGRNNQKNARQTNLLHLPVEASEREPMTPPLQHITGAQQSTLLCQNSQIPATMGSAREYDLIEGMSSQIKSWKDAYFSQFVELERRVVVPTLTEEQFSSLPAAKANEYKRKADTKKSIRKILNFLLLEKSDVNEGLKMDFPKYKNDIQKLVAFIERGKARNAKMNTGYQLRDCGEQPQVINLTGNATPISGGKSRQQKQPADASILQSRQTNMVRTPPPYQQSNGNRLLGIASPFSSPGSLQSCSSSMLESLTPSLVGNLVVAPASPCAPVIPMDVDSISALLHDNSAAPSPKANSNNQVTPTKPIKPASPRQADIAAGLAEVQARGGDGTPVTKKPIDRLMDAIRSSSPAALRSSANSIWSVLSINDIVPHGKIGTILDGKSSQQQLGGSNTVRKMKRVFNDIAARSESLPLGSMDGSCMSFECDTSDSGSSREQNIKLPKRQNAHDTLLKEIRSINSTLIDTMVSISVDGISSCDGGTPIKLSYSAVSLSPTVKSLFATSETSLVLPVKLFIPADYPSSSPVLISDEGDEVPRKNSSTISASADIAFRHVLGGLPEPRSIEAIARTWDACVRKAVTQFAHRQGGGTVSSIFGGWERCAAA